MRVSRLSVVSCRLSGMDGLGDRQAKLLDSCRTATRQSRPPFTTQRPTFAQGYTSRTTDNQPPADDGLSHRGRAGSGTVPPFSTTDESVNCHHNYVSIEHHYGQNVFVTRKGAVRAREGDLGIILTLRQVVCVKG